jgi:hypothetical protein
MHGLSHVTRDFKKGLCGCPPCASRLWAGAEEAEAEEAAEVERVVAEDEAQGEETGEAATPSI